MPGSLTRGSGQVSGTRIGGKNVPGGRYIRIVAGGETMISAILGLLATFHPAAVQSYAVDPVPYGAAAAGIVLLDVAVDGQGAVGDVRVLQDVAPFTDLIRGRLP